MLTLEALHYFFLRLVYAVANRYLDRRFLSLHVDFGYGNAIAKPLLQGCLCRDLARLSKQIAVGSEDELTKTAPELRTIHAFARRGEEHLFDELANMIFSFGGRSTPASIHLVGIGDVFGISAHRSFRWQ